MKKKVLTVLLTQALVASMLAGCGDNGSENTTDNSQKTENTDAADKTESGDTTDTAQDAPAIDYGSGEITIWVAENVVDLTQKLVDDFIASNDAYSGYAGNVTVEAVGEGDAASNMITDVAGGADIYGFAQDQLTRLVAAGALQPLNDNMSSWVTSSNDAGAIGAATSGDTLYAFPMTSDNGYFLYYDSTVVTDPTSLEQIIADCEAAGKGFYCDVDSAWYNASFFFGTGCTCAFETDADGNFTGVTADYASDAGLVAIKEMAEVASSKAFVDGSSAGEATNVGAIIDGTWDSAALEDMLGDNYACAALPSFEGADGKTYHMSGFSGNKLLGVKPQTEGGKLAMCYEIAKMLTDTDAQLERFNAQGWGPSNLTAQEDSTVKANVALAALQEQMPYMIPQGQYPGEWWDLAGALGADVENGTLTVDSSDEDFMAELKTHDDTCASLIQ
jgi:arabinogalactan oligomer/maltooligosaccharide transport system substrate-binding protein